MHQRKGETVTVRGETFRVVEVKSAASAGSRWHGKWVFILIGPTGLRYRTMGKRIMHNSRLTEIEPNESHQHDPRGCLECSARYGVVYSEDSARFNRDRERGYTAYGQMGTAAL